MHWLINSQSNQIDFNKCVLMNLNLLTVEKIDGFYGGAAIYYIFSKNRIVDIKKKKKSNK